MNHHSESIQGSSAKVARTKHWKPLAKQSPATIGRGLVFLGIAFLLGQCSLWFDTRPLGIALLCTATTYMWYILAGLSLSALLTAPDAIPSGGYLAVYALAILLRLLLLFLVDARHPIPDGRDKPSGRNDRLRLKRDTRRVADSWRSFSRFLPHRKKKTNPYEDQSEYYVGSRSVLHHPPACVLDEPDELQVVNVNKARTVSASDEPYEDPPSDIPTFHENIFLRMLTGSLSGFALGLFGLVRGGFQVYDLLGALSLVVAVPILIFLLAPTFHEEGLRLLFAECPTKSGSRERQIPLRDKEHPPYTAFSTVSVAALLSLSVYAARTIYFAFGISFLAVYLAPVLALLLCLISSRHLGLVPSVVAALCFGLAADPALVPPLLLAVLSHALVRLGSERIAVLSGCFAALLWCYLSKGVTGLSHLFPSFLLGLTIFFAEEKLRELFPPTPTVNHLSLTDFAISVTQRLQHRATQKRMASLSDAFSSLSQLFYGLSGQLRQPRPADYRRVCQSTFDKNCALCRHRKECHGQSSPRIEEAIRTASQRLARHGRLEVDHLPVEIRNICPRLPTIIQQINADCGHMTEVMRRSEKTEVFASDYEAIAAMLELAAHADREESQVHKEASDRIFDYLTEQGITVQGVVVCGNRERHITVRGRHFERGGKKAAEIKTELEALCGMRLTDPTFERMDDYTIMTLSSLPRMTTTYSGSTVPSDLEKGHPFPPALTENEASRERYTPPNPCGDHIAIFTNEQAYFYALISDGMGSGADASFTSDICAIFLEKMLSAGNQAEVSVKMLNNFIRSKNVGSGDECSATVDLMELDLNNGHAIFVKSGAAPTYVVRAGTVYKLHSRTVPIGIFKDSNPQLLRFRMHPGDVIVMVSDGVTHGNDECPWLIDLLSDPLPSNMDSLRLDILKHAVTSGSPDDLSAIAVRVEDAEETPK